MDLEFLRCTYPLDKDDIHFHFPGSALNGLEILDFEARNDFGFLDKCSQCQQDIVLVFCYLLYTKNFTNKIVILEWI